MSLYKRKDSPYWWIKLAPIPGESGPLQQSTGTADRKDAQQVHDRLSVSRWEQARLGVKARQVWEHAVLRWLQETTHKATHADDKAKLRWLDPYLAGKYLDEIDRTVIDRIKFERDKLASAGTTNRRSTRAIRRSVNAPFSFRDCVAATTSCGLSFAPPIERARLRAL